MKFLDVKNKKLNWWNRNYFYLGTIFIICLNISIFALFGGNWQSSFGDLSAGWNEPFNLSNIVRSFFNTFSHGDWKHVLINMLCVSISGLYIERKTGTFNFLLLIFGSAILSSGMVTAATVDLYYHGFSGVVYVLYAYVFVDYIFSFQKARRNKFDMIFGAVITLTIYIFMSSSTDDGLKIVFYPVDLIYNMGHYSSAIAGLIIALIVQISQLSIIKQSVLMVDTRRKLSKAIKIVYSCVAVLIVALIGTTTPVAIVASQRTSVDYSITIDCNIDEFDKTFDYHFPEGPKRVYDFIDEWQYSFDVAERDGYGFEVYADKDYKNRLTVDGMETIYDSIYGYEDFIPLGFSTHKTFYVKMFKGYEVTFSNAGMYFDEGFLPNPDLNKFSFYRNRSSIVIEEGESFTFEVYDLRSQYNAGGLIVYADGQEISHDGKWNYTIENITQNTIISFDYKF